MNSAKLIEVIETKSPRGDGAKENPHRLVTNSPWRRIYD